MRRHDFIVAREYILEVKSAVLPSPGSPLCGIDLVFQCDHHPSGTSARGGFLGLCTQTANLQASRERRGTGVSVSQSIPPHQRRHPLAHYNAQSRKRQQPYIARKNEARDHEVVIVRRIATTIFEQNRLRLWHGNTWTSIGTQGARERGMCGARTEIPSPRTPDPKVEGALVVDGQEVVAIRHALGLFLQEAIRTHQLNVHRIVG